MGAYEINMAICVWRAMPWCDEAMTSSISFDEITVRCALVDGVQHLSIRDLIMAVCKKDNNQAAEIWRKHNLKAELEPYCSSFKFPGRGQSEQPVIQVQGAMKLVMALPGENAKLSRVADILSKTDAPKIDTRNAEIQAKALEERLKIENDALRKDLELKSDALKKELELKTVINCALMLDKIKLPNQQETSLGGVVRDMGISNLSSTDIQSIGCIASAKYRAAYGFNPPKRMQKDKSGKEIWVNDYSEEDVPMIQEAVREFQAKSGV
jgi:hypothetical protein